MKLNKVKLQSLFLIVVVIGFLSFSVAILNTMLSSQEEEFFELDMLLLDLERANNEENEALLSAAKEEVITYDRLVSARSDIRAIEERINQLLPIIEGEFGEAERFEPLFQKVKRKGEIIEEFKSRNSVLYNSVNSLNLLQVDSSLMVKPEIKQLVKSLKANMLHFKVFGDESAKERVIIDVVDLVQQKNKSHVLDMLIVHTNNVLEYEDIVNDLLSSAIDLKIGNDAAMIREDLERVSKDYVEIVSRSLYAYILLSVVFVTVIGFSLAKLRRSSREIEIAKDSLEDEVKMRTEQLTRRNKELEDYSYIATHDLKVPIDNLEGYIDLLALELGERGKSVEEILDWINKSIGQSKKVLSDLNDVSSASTGSMELSKINLKSFFEEIFEIYENQLKDINGKVKWDFYKAQNVVFSKIHLKSVLHNLLSNAIKYRSQDRGLQVKIKTSKSDGFIRLDFEDNGIGIDLERQYDKLFGLFRRIEKRGEGSGIGMYLVKRIIEDQGGRVEVESELEKGTKFSLFFRITKL